MIRTATLWLVVALALGWLVSEPAWSQDPSPPAGNAAVGDAPVKTGEQAETAISNAPDSTTSQLHEWLTGVLPEWALDGQLLTLAYWQWIALFVLILLGMAIDIAVRVQLRVVLQRVTRRAGAETDKAHAGRVVRPLGLAAAAVFWLWLLPVLHLNDGAAQIVGVAVRLMVVLSSVWAAWGIVDSIAAVLMAKAEKTETKIDDVLVPLFRKTMKIFAVILGVVYGASAMNVEIAPLLAGLGIGGLAMGLAAKDTLENFFGSVAVVLDRPFHVGDWIVVDDTEGIVEEVGFRSTRVRTFYNSLVTVPNATLVRTAVDNYGARRYRRWKTYIGVQYDTPPDRMLAFVEGIREFVRHHPYTRKDYFQVYLNDFADSSLNILLYVFFEVPDWPTELRERERLFVDIVRLADQLGVSFAFPTQTIHLYQEDQNAVHTPARIPQEQTDQAALDIGVTAAHRIISQQPWRDERPGPVEFHDGAPVDDTDEDHPPIEDRTRGE